MKFYLIVGFLVLVAASYLDNVRGPLLPLITAELKIPYSVTGLFLTCGNFAATIAILLMNPVIRKLGEKKTALFLCAFGAIGSLFAHVVVGEATLLLFSILLGAGIASLGTMANVMVIKGASDVKRGHYLSALHITYGVASFVAPYVVGSLVTHGVRWPFVFSGILIWFACAMMFILKGKETKILSGSHTQQELSSKEENIPDTHRDIGSIAKAFLFIIFSLYVGGEVLTSMWLSTYLVEYRNLTIDRASLYVSGFFLCLAASRLFSFIWVTPKYEMLVIWLVLFISLGAMLIGHAGYFEAFMFVGLLGPFFPLFLAKVSRLFGREWRRLTIWLIACIQLFLGFLHYFVGLVVDRFGAGIAFYAPLISLSLAILLLLGFNMIENQRRFG